MRGVLPANQVNQTPQTVWSAFANRLIRFLLASGFATLLHWGVMASLVWTGQQPVLATAVGAVAGSILNYLCQFHWTFAGRGRHARALPAYACIVMLGWMVNAGLFYALISVLQAGLATAQLLATLVVAAMNFVLYQRIVFHERTNRSPAA